MNKWRKGKLHLNNSKEIKISRKNKRKFMNNQNKISLVNLPRKATHKKINKNYIK